MTLNVFQRICMKSTIFTGFQWGSSPEVNFLELGRISEVLRCFRELDRNCGARTTKRRLIPTIKKDFRRFARISKVGSELELGLRGQSIGTKARVSAKRQGIGATAKESAQRPND